MNIKKSGSNASWNQLPLEARKQLETWLFDDCFNYEKVLDLARSQLGYTGSLSSLKRYYSRLARERVIATFTDSQKHVAEIEAAKTSAGQLRNAGLKIMAQLFLRQVVEKPDNVRQWGWMARLLLQSEENEIKKRAAAEYHELRCQSLQLARERFRFNVVEQAYSILPQLKALEQARKSPQQTRIEELARLRAIKRIIFGKELPPEPPESADPAGQALIEAEAGRMIEEDRRARAAKAAAGGEVSTDAPDQ